MLPTAPGHGYRFLVQADRFESPRRGDEYWDHAGQEWRPINIFWRRQFGNGGQQLERRPTLLDWQWCEITTSWIGVLNSDTYQVDRDGAPIIDRTEVVINVDQEGWFNATWDLDGEQLETQPTVRFPSLWDAIAWCEKCVEDTQRKQASYFRGFANAKGK